jgi:DNA-binding transcriptional LysR family regulator
MRDGKPVVLTAAGAVLYDEARTVLGQVEHARARMTTAAGYATPTIGTPADTVEQAGSLLATAIRARHPQVVVAVRGPDFSGIRTHVLRSDPVGVVLRTDDPLADRDVLQLDDLARRHRIGLECLLGRWFGRPAGRAGRAHRRRVPASSSVERDRRTGPVPP